MGQKEYAIAVSYASEQRAYVERFVKSLQRHKLRVYYDRNEQAKMVGKILDQALQEIYIQKSEHCVLFLSKAYIEKPITQYESGIILSETLFEKDFMYIFKFDDVTLPGLNRNFIYSSIQEYPEPESYADFMREVIGGKKVKRSAEKPLYDILADGVKQIMEHCAQQYGLEFQSNSQRNKSLFQVRSGAAVLVQLQIGVQPGKSGVSLWLHRGCRSCDEHAYQGYVEWSAKDCCYYLKNDGILLELTPELAFNSTDSVLVKLEAAVDALIGN